MTAPTMPQAASLAETTPLNHRDRQYRAEGIAGRICDVRNLLIAMDHVQQDRITGFADFTGNGELAEACDLIASMHVIAVEALETTARHADELATLLTDLPDATWDAAMARWHAAEADAAAFHAPFAPDYKMPEEAVAEANRLDEVASGLQFDLMNMPAPHFAALRYKLEHLLKDDDGSTNIWASDFVAQTRRDIARLLGEA